MTRYQEYAVMVLCAADVDTLWHTLNPSTRPDVALPVAGDARYAYVTGAYWTALGQLRCDDAIFSAGDNTYYGLLLRCHTAFAHFQVGDYMVAVRGTMSQIEWENNALAAIKIASPRGVGQVAAGFWGVYNTMTLNDLSGANGRVDPSHAIAAVVQAAPGRVFVTGHSLGAALSTYLAIDLQATLAGVASAFWPYFFASPMTGTSDYVDHYQATVASYTLVNYAIDIVPAVPPILLGYQALRGGGPTHDVHTIPPFAPGALMPPDVPHNHSPVGYARMLDPTNAVALRLPVP